MVEVGLGGRFDATNVLEPEAVAACGIAALGIDHERFLLAPEDGVPKEPMARIAFEKAGIAKRGVPLVTMDADYPDEARRAIHATANDLQPRLIEMQPGEKLKFGKAACALRGDHQLRNAALAAAMIREQSAITVAEEAMVAGLASAKWPARMQQLSPGPLTGTRETWLDGGHNRSAGEALASEFEGLMLHLVIGMLKAKDPAALIEPLAGSIASINTVPVPGHDHHEAAAFGPNASSAPDLSTALAALPDDGLPVLIAGSLYLAGEALRLNDEIPD